MSEHTASGRTEIPLMSGAVMRRTDLSDAPALFRGYRANRKRLRAAGIHVPKNQHEIENRIKLGSSSHSLDYGIWVNDEVAGQVVAIEDRHNPREAHVFYWVDTRHARQGHVSNAVEFLVGQAFKNPETRVLTAHVRSENTASQRVLQKAGFRLVGESAESKTLFFAQENPNPVPLDHQAGIEP